MTVTTTKAVSLAGKVALVTVASRGIGAATARALAEAGAAVVLAARAAAKLEEVATTIAESGDRALAVPTDVTDEQAVEELIRRAVSHVGGLDAAVNAAGGGPAEMKSLAAVAPVDLDAGLALNLGGAYLAMRHEIPSILDSGGGAIANITSGAGSAHPAAGTTPYVTAKHALQGMTRWRPWTMPNGAFGAMQSRQARLTRTLRRPGNTFDYVCELDGEVLTIWAGEKCSPAYYTGEFSGDGDSITGAWVYPGGGGYKATSTRVR